MDELVAELCEIVKGKTLQWLTGLGVLEAASLTVIQQAMSRAGRATAEAVAAAWRQALERTKLRRIALEVAGRVGLGSNSRSIGLGDMGSELASAFEEAFFDYPGSFWNADWKHSCDYVEAARKVLSRRFDGLAWAKAMRDAIWNRDQVQRDLLLAQARAHRIKVLPRELDKCPVAALRTYLTNNWKHMRFAELKALGLPFVSARAESQVRVRTKDRFCTAGAWRLKNIEPKATLRSIIADGRWPSFRAHVLEQHRCRFEKNLLARLRQAVEDRRLSAQQLAGPQRPRPFRPARRTAARTRRAGAVA